METGSENINTLRWLCFVPGAFLGASIAFFLVFYSLSLPMGTFRAVTYSGGFPIDLMSNAIAGAVFVYVGARIAPGHRKVVTYILAAIAILIAGFLAYPAIVQENWLHVISVMGMASGAGLIAYKVSDGELDLDTHMNGQGYR